METVKTTALATNTNKNWLSIYTHRGELAPADLLASYTPKQVAKVFRSIDTAEKAMSLVRNSKIVSLSALALSNDVHKVETILKIHLVELNDLLGLKQPLTEAQIEAIASEIFAKYPYLTIVDINVVLGQIKRGERGKLYDRLTMPHLMQIFSEYNDERSDAAARMSLAEADYYKVDHARSSDQARAVYQRARKMDFERIFKEKGNKKGE